MDMENQRFIEKFESVYGKKHAGIMGYYAPRATNLLGDHTDYSGGMAISCIFSFGTRLFIRPRPDFTIRLMDMYAERPLVLNLEHDEGPVNPSWFSKPFEIIRNLTKINPCIRGMDMLYARDVRFGRALSSSASMELLTGWAVGLAFGCSRQMDEMIEICRKVARLHDSINYSVMDHFAVALGRPDQALFFEAASRKTTYYPFDLGMYRLVVIAANNGRDWNNALYQQRHAECGLAIEIFKRNGLPADLGQIDYNLFIENRHLIAEPELRYRIRHLVAENLRVKDAAKYLQQGNIEGLGRLMHASHNSLRDNYQVSTVELDTLVHLATQRPDCPGARMTESGIQGSVIALVKEDAIEEFVREVGRAYYKSSGFEAAFIPSADAMALTKLV